MRGDLVDTKHLLDIHTIQKMIDKALRRGDTYSATILRKIQKEIENI